MLRAKTQNAERMNEWSVGYRSFAYDVHQTQRHDEGIICAVRIGIFFFMSCLFGRVVYRSHVHVGGRVSIPTATNFAFNQYDNIFLQIMHSHFISFCGTVLISYVFTPEVLKI